MQNIVEKIPMSGWKVIFMFPFSFMTANLTLHVSQQQQNNSLSVDSHFLRSNATFRHRYPPLSCQELDEKFDTTLVIVQ